MQPVEFNYAQANTTIPEKLNIEFNSGNKLMAEGRIEEAILAFGRAIDLQPGFVQAHYALSLLKTYSKDDPHLHMLEKRVSLIDSLPEPLREKFWFALGKMREDAEDYDLAFAAYRKGNDLARDKTTWFDSAEDKLLENTINAFSKEWFSTKQPRVTNSKTPIFVVGMPRSGTTLIEQILATIPGVYGASELSFVSDGIVNALSDKTFENSFHRDVVNFTPEMFEELGNEYIRKAWELSPESTYIVDKMPANTFYLGLMYLMFPNAKFIHARRDPMDSCFSCYSKLFNNRNLPYSYDIEKVARYYVRYAKLVAHWESVLPEGTIHNIDYASMVNNTETEAHRLLEYIGIPWDESCLKFYENKRYVKTTSMSQVRKPIYKTAVARWENFKDHLGPMLEIVKDYR